MVNNCLVDLEGGMRLKRMWKFVDQIEIIALCLTRNAEGTLEDCLCNLEEVYVWGCRP